MRTVLRICVWAGVQTSMSLRPLPNLGQRRDADGLSHLALPTDRQRGAAREHP